MVKKYVISTIMSIMIATTVFPISQKTKNVEAAQQEIIKDNYTYTVETNGKSTYAVIKDYKGNQDNLVLPEELDGLPVKAIAFTQKNLKIKSITLSKNIASSRETKYGVDTLSNIETLEEINVSKENQDYEAIDGVLYNKGKTEFYVYPRSKKSDTYVMPSSVKKSDSIGLSRTKYLKKLTLSENLKNTMECSESNIESVTIPGKIQTIEETSFFNCKKLKNVEIGKNVHTIFSDAFRGCNSLEQILLPEGLKNIGAGTFANTALKEVQIPDTVVNIGGSAFDSNVKLKKRSYLKKYKSEAGAIYYQARATVKIVGKKKTYKATKITKIQPNIKKVVLKKGKKTKIQTKISYAKKLKKGYLDPSILKFTTSNKKIATVSKYGNIKGVKKGKATITVKLRTSGIKYKVNVVVK